MKRYKPMKTSHEFELDLAPLLSVMVKLVPVLLISSAFIQLATVDTDIPQVVAQVNEEQKKNPVKKLVLKAQPDGNLSFEIYQEGKRPEQRTLAATGEKKINWVGLKALSAEIKKNHSEVFQVFLEPAPQVSYQDVIFIMDVLRKSSVEKFEFKDPSTGEVQITPFMFPDVVLANVVEG